MLGNTLCKWAAVGILSLAAVPAISMARVHHATRLTTGKTTLLASVSHRHVKTSLIKHHHKLHTTHHKAKSLHHMHKGHKSLSHTGKKA